MLHDFWDWFRKDYATSLRFFENAFGPQAPCCEEAQPGPYGETLWKDPEARRGGSGGEMYCQLSAVPAFFFLTGLHSFPHPPLF